MKKPAVSGGLSWCAVDAASDPGAAAPDQRDHRDDQEDDEQDPGDVGHRAGDAAEAEHRGDDGEDEEQHGVVEHGSTFPLRACWGMGTVDVATGPVFSW